ncbi:hypothetical protein QBC38DRAFT_405742 [Podospora fimiseda]|uniref:Tim44-like domain-containing protein n=1 Tax=Podospora fimiseda TaxID=252190 RepID=A0AAN7H524_9PEZI|nr:hypothetical protein QBC38DRAFT_405742 [Podospora fimiseda]
MSVSSTLGLRGGASNMLSMRSTKILPRSASLTTRCSFSTSQRNTAPGQGKLKRMIESRNKSIAEGNVAPSRSQRAANMLNETSSAPINMVFPGTFVRPPLSEFPKHPMQLFRFLKHMILAKMGEQLQLTLMKWKSKPTLFTRAIWQHKHSAVVLTAKGLHRSMAEAFVAGDKSTISHICTTSMGTPLLGAIDKRPRNRRYGWEIEYTKKTAYPALRSSRLMPTSPNPNANLVRQAVVAIASKQRRVEHDDSPRGGGQIVPGSEKEIEVIENVVIVQLVNPHTWEPGEWRIVGTVKPTTLEGWEAELKLTQELETAEALRK